MLFCTKCGEKLQDDAVFCTKCGTKTESNLAGQTPYLNTQSQPYFGGAAPRKSSKTLLTVIAAGVLVVVLAVVLILTLGGGSDLGSPEAAVNSLLSAIAKSDLKGMVKCTTYGRNLTDQQIDIMLNAAGTGNKEVLAAEGLESFLYGITDDYDADDIDLSKGISSLKLSDQKTEYNSGKTEAIVTGSLTIAAKSGDTQKYDVEIEVIKGTDGKWYVEM